MTPTSLFQWEAGGSEITENEEISARQYYDVAVEPGGTFWLATSDGLFRYAPLAWRNPPALKKVNSLVYDLTGDKAGRLWFVSGGALHGLENDAHREYPLPEGPGRGVKAAHGVFVLKNGALLIDAGSECFSFEPASGAFTKLAPQGRYGTIKGLGLLRDGSICVETSDLVNADQGGRVR